MLTNIITTLRTLRHDDKGATAIEYGLIAALVGVVLMAGLGTLAGGLNALFARIATILAGA